MNELARRTTVSPDGRVRIQQNAVRGVLRILATVGVVGSLVGIVVEGGLRAWPTLPNLVFAAATVALLVRVWPARVEVGPDDLVVVNPFRTLRVRREQVAAVRARSVFVAVALGLDLHDGSRVLLVGCSRWSRRGLVPTPAWFDQAQRALEAWARDGTRPPTTGTPD